ncbi:MAG TPA: class I SAM-dependent RNA methyltransferase [Ktedonobacterales bacterium]|jgi:23S rRNA (uracil1939-C5)-methyltransferase|nr:class I SAM-dependent RNA methyltransferase [Ktedonobacterales bacterium]
MTAQPRSERYDTTTDTADTAPATPGAPRFVVGRYVARVTALLPDGLAHAIVTEALDAPAEDVLRAIYGPAWDARPELHSVTEAFDVIGALSGELVELEVSWSLPRPGRKRARRTPPPVVRLTRVIESAPERVAPPCPVFGMCGGCQLQQMAYPAQLAWKTERVRDLLRGSGFADPPVRAAIGCEPPWNYRNHMRFSVDRDGRVGLTARGTHRLIPLTTCPIAEPRINDALAALAQEPQPQPQALVRYGVATGQMLLQPAPQPGTRARLAAAGLDLRDETMEEEIGAARFRIRPSSFFQTNTAQAQVMARLALAELPSGPEVTLVDAYCGVGVFARLMAERAGRVLAIEESASAVRDARWNLRETPQVEIIQAKVEDDLPTRAERIDGLIIDPPRAGCQRPVLDALATRRPPVVVYISCGPTTLARDLAYLCHTTGAYRLRSVQPLDMFPQTAHIENIATLDAIEDAIEDATVSVTETKETEARA